MQWVNQDETEDNLSTGHCEVEQRQWILDLVRPGLRLNDVTLGLLFFPVSQFLHM